MFAISFIDLQLLVAVCSLCYVLPTTAKKALYAHQYLVDLVMGNSTELETSRLCKDRCQPYVQVYGQSWSNRSKMVLYADKVPVCTFQNVAKAVDAVFALYYILDVEYSSAVYPTLQFLQIKCLGINCNPRCSVQQLLTELGHDV